MATQPVTGSEAEGRVVRVHWRLVLTLMVVVIAYVLIGAGIFYILEKHTWDTNTDVKSESVHKFITTHQCVSKEEADRFIDLFATDIYRSRELWSYDNFTQHNNTREWGFGTSIYFVVTIMTTIGYGDVVPLTPQGRAFCCIFALLGIPMCLVLLANVGGGLYVVIKRVDDRFDCFKRHPRRAKAVRSAGLFASGLILLVLVPANMFCYVEEWTYAESVYYAFLTLATVGLGDYVPGQGESSWYLICMVVWLFLGLAWLSTTINSTQELINALLRTEAKIRTSNVNRKGRYNAQQLMERSDRQDKVKAINCSGRSVDGRTNSPNTTSRDRGESTVSVSSTCTMLDRVSTSLTDIDLGSTGVYRQVAVRSYSNDAPLGSQENKRWSSETDRALSMDSRTDLMRTSTSSSIQDLSFDRKEIFLSASDLNKQSNSRPEFGRHDKGVQVGMALYSAGQNAIHRAGIATIYPLLEQDRDAELNHTVSTDDLSLMVTGTLHDTGTVEHDGQGMYDDVTGRNDASQTCQGDVRFRRFWKDLVHDDDNIHQPTEGRRGQDEMLSRKQESEHNELSFTDPANKVKRQLRSSQTSRVNVISLGNNRTVLVDKVNGTQNISSGDL